MFIEPLRNQATVVSRYPGVNGVITPMVPGLNYFDFQQTAVVVLSADLKVLTLNSAAENLFGISANRLCGRKLGRAWLNIEDYQQIFLNVAARLQPMSQHDVVVDLAGGVKRHCRISATPVEQQSGTEILLEFDHREAPLSVVRDSELRALQQISDGMLRGFAHEVKNPLGGLRGAAQLLARELPNDELKEYTNVIIAEADRLGNLVNRMLTPNAEPEMVAVNIHQILDRIYALVTVELPDRVTLMTDYDPSIPDIMGDPELLIQGILNVVRNAQQALVEAGGYGQIVLRTRVRRNMTIGHQRHRLVAQLDIIDDGPGVPEQLREQIFYPLITGRAEGSGLGLPIAQSLINQQGGVINFTSSPGHTVFSIFLTLEGET